MNSALAEAMAADPGPAQAEPQSSGPPLTQGERDGLRVAVSRCWNIAALSTRSARVTVIVGMEMSLDGVPSNLRMVSYSGGTGQRRNRPTKPHAARCCAASRTPFRPRNMTSGGPSR